jgi:hypothetical protein
MTFRNGWMLIKNDITRRYCRLIHKAYLPVTIINWRSISNTQTTARSMHPLHSNASPSVRKGHISKLKISGNVLCIYITSYYVVRICTKHLYIMWKIRYQKFFRKPKHEMLVVGCFAACHWQFCHSVLSAQFGTARFRLRMPYRISCTWLSKINGNAQLQLCPIAYEETLSAGKF